MRERGLDAPTPAAAESRAAFRDAGLPVGGRHPTEERPCVFACRRGPHGCGGGVGAAAALWPGERPIGKRFAIGQDDAPLWFEVIGVGDIRTTGLDQPSPLTIYIPEWIGVFPLVVDDQNGH